MDAQTVYSFQTAGKIVSGVNSIETINEHIRGFGVSRALVVTDRGVFGAGLVDRPRQLMESAGVEVDVLPDVVPEPPIGLIDELSNKIKGKQYDLFIGIGGGSSLDVTKLLAVRVTNPEPLEDLIGTDKISRRGIPTLLIPTTAGTGSEVTPNAIVTLVDQELKVGIVSKHLLPDLVILDPVLTLDLPPAITAATGMDALIHAVESYISRKANPLSDVFALESVRLVSRSILKAYRDGRDINARHDMLLGAMFAGMALTSAGTCAVHALAYPLGGKFGIPHGISNSMLLIPVMEYNFSAVHQRLSEIAAAMGIETRGVSQEKAAAMALEKMRQLVSELNIPTSLCQFGVKPDDLDQLATSASKVTRLLNNNPREMPVEEIRKVYARLIG